MSPTDSPPTAPEPEVGDVNDDEFEQTILGELLAAYRAYAEPRYDALIRGRMTGEPIGLLAALQPGGEFESWSETLGEPRGLLATLRLSDEPETRRAQLDEPPTGAVGLFQMLGGELPSPLAAADPRRCPRRPDPASTRPRIRLRHELPDGRPATVRHHAARLWALPVHLDEQAFREALLPPRPVELPPTEPLDPAAVLRLARSMGLYGDAEPRGRAHLTAVPDPDEETPC